MSTNSRAEKLESGPQAGGGGVVSPPVKSCRKKKADVNEGFVKDMMNHIDEFVHASYDEHKTCLTKTVRKLFGGMAKVGQTPSSAPSTPVVSVLPLRVNTSSD